MKRIRTSRPRSRRERPWPEELPADPRDADVVRAKALARTQPGDAARTDRAHQAETMHPGEIETAQTPAQS